MAGYGRAWFKRKMTLAHRLLYEMMVGPIPDGYHIDHLCKNVTCVNPDHLEPVTPGENARRSAAGMRSGAQKMARTECPHGHPFNETNTYRYSGNNGRQCRSCHAVSQRRYTARRKAEADNFS